MSRSFKNGEAAEVWRQRLGLLGALSGTGGASGQESAGSVLMAIDDRIAASREAMMRIVKDDHHAESGLLNAVRSIEQDSREGVMALASGSSALSDLQLAAFEAVVAFDGTRPSFLIRDDRVDFASSFSTSAWKTTLSPRLEGLAKVATCVGRLEVGDVAIGTAFLVTPTLALTNRHVAQAIAAIGHNGAVLRCETFVDFGREDRGRCSFDRRQVLDVIFAGEQAITSTVDHSKLDIALIELTPSTLAGEMADRALPLDGSSVLEGNVTVAVIGYPGDWSRWVPASARNAHTDALAKLLAGRSGAKRFAPGASAGSAAPGPMTACHDATTINGNSGSPLLLLNAMGAIPIVGLHYGGRWNGTRTNWAHLFSLCRDAPVNRGKVFYEALQDRSIGG